MAGQFLGDKEVKIDKISSTDGSASLDVSNRKITNVSDPTNAQDAATKNYVDSTTASGSPDATTTVKGKIQLAGDLGGTASAPTVKNRTYITVGKNDSTADFNTADYANDSLAIIAAVTAASSTNKGRKVVIRGDDSTVYTVGDSSILLPSNFTFESQPGVILRVKNNPSGTNPVSIRNSDSNNGNTNITLRNITGDGNGANQVAGQSSGGVFMVFTGVQNLNYDNVKVYDSIRYNSFIGIPSGTSIAGTATFTIDSDIVTGSGTSFTSLSVGQRLRAASGNLTTPIATIISNTSIRLSTPWQHETETGVALTSVQGVKFSVKDSTFGRTYEDDTFGGGGWDYTKIDNSTFENSAGYGLGSTGLFGGTISNIYAHNNQNGLGLERVSNTMFSNVITEYNNSKGVNLINGSHNNTFVNVISRYNADGFYDANSSSTKGRNSRNTYSNCIAEYNKNNGFNIAGVLRPTFNNCIARNNSTSSAGTYYGIVLQAANSYNTVKAVIRGCRGYDDQTTQTQTKDIYLAAGAVDTQVDYNGFDVISGLTSPNYAPSTKILNGGKTISITSSSARPINNYETYILCNQDTYQHMLPRLLGIVDGHTVKFIYNGSNTPNWTFVRHSSDSFGTLEDYTQIPQDGHFWIQWTWDNNTKRWFISGSSYVTTFSVIDGGSA
jgi:hypothetical protein